MIKAKIIGAGGYGGVGIVELLTQHPEVEILCLVAKDSAGKSISELYPHLAGTIDMQILQLDAPEAQVDADVVFMATPDRVGMNLAAKELERGAKVIDYSGDFRFDSPDEYADYATRIGLDTIHSAPDLLLRSAYGLPELYRDQINADRDIVGNPGCFAVSCILGLAPAVANAMVDPGSIICDCKTGISGAGKKANDSFHYPARYENMNAYRLTGHQHVCEIEKELSRLAGAGVQVTFTAQALPITRGIMSTLYANLADGQSAESVLNVYRDFYSDEPFVDVHDHSAELGSIHVRGTNRASLVVAADDRTGRFRVISYIDNLMKGQAGSALQNMNLLFALPETMGLTRPGMYP